MGNEEEGVAGLFEGNGAMAVLLGFVDSKFYREAVVEEAGVGLENGTNLIFMQNNSGLAGRQLPIGNGLSHLVESHHAVHRQPGNDVGAVEIVTIGHTHAFIYFFE